MSQLVGLHNGLDQQKNTVLRSPMLTVPAAAYADGRIMRPTNANYAQQTVQITDDMGNAASHIRIANGGYRTVQRVINEVVTDGLVHVVRMPNNVGTGNITYARPDGMTAPTGYLKLLDDHDHASALVLSPSMSVELDSNTHRLAVQGVGAAAGDCAVITYAMEIYIANIVFSAMPAVRDLISFGDYAMFEFCAEGDPSTVSPHRFPVEIPNSGLIVDLCTNLRDMFNFYISKVQPLGSQIPYHWARLIDATDMVYYFDGSGWLDATNLGVQFNSIDAAMIRNTASSITAPSLQISKQL